MPEFWTADDVTFARVRALHCDAARDVVASLVAAVGEPAARLRGSTALQAYLQAAEILIDAGDLSGAATPAQQALATAGPHPDADQRFAVASVLADARQPAVAVALAELAAGDATGSFAGLLKVALRLAASGYFEQALELTDVMVTRQSERPAARPSLRVLGPRIEEIAGLAKAEIGGIRQRAEAGGLDLADPRVVLAIRAGQLERSRQQAAAQPPWPALAASALLWWPEPQYDRMIGQVPELAAVLGPAWPQHRAMVESYLRSALPPGSRVQLAAAELGIVVGHLETTGADPKLPTTMTDATAAARQQQTRLGSWPPGRRDACWCGGGEKYRNCCGRTG